MPKKRTNPIAPTSSQGSVPRNLPLRRWAPLRVASPEYGISIPELFRLCVSGEVEASHRLKPGKKRGTWLINCESLERYITSFQPGGSRYIPTPPEASPRKNERATK